MKSILITGGAGFIGSNFVLYFLKKYPNYHIVNLDLLTYAGSLENLKGVESFSNYTFIQGDICDEGLVNEIFTKYEIESVIHFAAESHVDNSIANPNAFIKTNVNGTFNLLHTAYLHWFEAPHIAKRGKENCVFHHISTDEVFGSLGESGYFTESTPYAPNSPYSASKASSDMLVRSYIHTYGLKAFITNCSNNYGPKQHDEKLIPTIIRNALQGETIPIYGDGKNVRDWLYVEDHCRAIDVVFHSQCYSETFNVGGNCERVNIEIAKHICALLDEIAPRADKKSYQSQIAFVQDRVGHDRRYAIDSSKIAKILDWKPQESFASGLEKTLRYYVRKYNV
ncbi:dTDP-glucose 4,6-dehydratase [Helicobacter bilis]|uniref:dTDP-glucose 4,6-dehydratase n=1 Tax=Helicobacter bilis TaxID=37372 RepID=UPI0026F0900F|nr:dTDP-glucose 4,6-dehydratase [Helicobacter bilis]MCI7410169.1 dTDP-glucose 4,6-dehydratase [Helicobacter bilis]MDD7297507.1 dTDP-glucose 4,6-dehydratase [Helicobacter bilis]MDY4399933.1 dTDP-glucose 4,6-dehydratase [Helicobacter bilis]